MALWDVIGIVAGVCVALQWVPELWHAWKYKSLKDVNWLLTVFGITGAFLFFLYGLHIGDPIVASINAFIGVCIILLALMKWSFERK